MKVIKKNQSGVITIEASLSFMIFMFLIMFIYCFSNVYIAQNTINHATIQAAQRIALESYGREKLGNSTVLKSANGVKNTVENTVNTFSNVFFNKDGGFELSFMDSVTPIDSASQLEHLIKKAMIESMVQSGLGSNADTDADNKLKSIGIDKAWDDISFSGTKLTTKDIIIVVTYDVHLKYPFMGIDKITITKSAKSRLFMDASKDIVIN